MVGQIREIEETPPFFLRSGHKKERWTSASTEILAAGNERTVDAGNAFTRLPSPHPLILSAKVR